MDTQIKPLIARVPVIRFHQRLKHGWQHSSTAEAYDTKAWDAQDRKWIDTLLASGDTVLTVGNIMYELQWKST